MNAPGMRSVNERVCVLRIRRRCLDVCSRLYDISARFRDMCISFDMYFDITETDLGGNPLNIICGTARESRLNRTAGALIYAKVIRFGSFMTLNSTRLNEATILADDEISFLHNNMSRINYIIQSGSLLY